MQLINLERGKRMRKLTKMSAMLLASGIILTGCGGNKGLEEKKENKQLTYTTVKDIGDMNPHVYGGSCLLKV